jgi:thiol-disulfide isomerase/thioredoxin
MVAMMIMYRIFSRAGMVLLAMFLIFGCSPEPEATPASTGQITQKIKTSNAPLLLVHVWATWCDPCREEFPELIKIHANYTSKGLAILLISADDPDDSETVKVFLLEQNSPIDSLIATKLDQDFIESFSPNWSGALPSSFFFGADGKLLEEWEGKRSYKHYAETIETLLKQTKGDTP